MALHPLHVPALPPQAGLQSEHERTAGPLSAARPVDEHEDVDRGAGAGLRPCHRHTHDAAFPPAREHDLLKVLTAVLIAQGADAARSPPRFQRGPSVVLALEHGEGIRAEQAPLGDLELEASPSDHGRRAQTGVGERQPPPVPLLQEDGAIKTSRRPVLSQGGDGSDGAVFWGLIAQRDVRSPGPPLGPQQRPGRDRPVQPRQRLEPGPADVQEHDRVDR